MRHVQVVGREREWTEDPAKAQRVRAALEACIGKKGSDVSIAKLFQVMLPGVYKWCEERTGARYPTFVSTEPIGSSTHPPQA